MNRESKAKHTPAPWREFDGDIISESDIYGNIVCSAPLGFTESMERWHENARLIAAAPAMLEMLQEIADKFDKDQHLLNVSPTKIIELIKKIEG